MLIALVYAVLVAGDAATTTIGLGAGGTELSPLGEVAAVVVKVVLVVALLGLVRAADAGWRGRAAVPGLIALSLPVAWNVAQLAAVAP